MSHYRRECSWSVKLKEQLRDAPEKLQITINEDGSTTMIDSSTARILADALGTTIVSRASHVEPENVVLRSVFHFIRTRVVDDSRLAAWTRTWRCLWRVTLASPFGGDTLPGRWRNRADAIAVEVEYLNEYFANR